MRPVVVAGVGIWAPGFAGTPAWLAGREDPAVIRPPCGMLDKRIGRYTSLVTRMAVEVTGQAAADGEADLSGVATLFGSANGEIRTAFEQLDMIALDGVPSPARFKNSVHNTASGHVSIASRNMGFSTSLAAGDATFAICLLEAFAWLESHRGEIIVAVADESLPDHLASAGRYDPLGVAFHLQAVGTTGVARGRLSGLGRRNFAGAPMNIPERFARNPVAAALPLVETVLRNRSGTVSIAPGSAPWCVDLEAGEEGGR